MIKILSCFSCCSSFQEYSPPWFRQHFVSWSWQTNFRTDFWCIWPSHRTFVLCAV